MNERNFKSIPVAACRMACGEVEFRDNGPNAKSAPIKLKARSGGSIEHWYWGRVIHDLAGMRMHKARLPVDYAHNESEILGYLNHFDITSGDLVASGALTPWREEDRASEVMYKMREGVPYEASIFFGGDGIKIQEVAAGQVETVNGRQFEGPGVIIREWPLRGVAICPYGADSNTESVALANGETVAAQEWKQPQQEIAEMNVEKPAVEVEAVAEVAEVAAVETPAVEAEAVEVKKDEAQELTAAPVKPEAEKLAALTTERDTLATALTAAEAQVLELLAKVTAADGARLAAEQKLAAFMASGQLPISAEPAEGKITGSLMERARKSKKG